LKERLLCSRHLAFSTEAAAQGESAVPPPSNADSPPPIVWTTHLLTPESIAKVDSIFHKILWLDIFETHMLTSLVNNRLGLKITPKQAKAIERQMEQRTQAQKKALGQGGSEKSSEIAAVEEDNAPKVVDLKLVSFDATSKIKVIKEVRAIVSGLGLKEAKELVESALPKTVLKGIKPEQAELFQKQLEAAGAKVDVG
jgi:large subunit ribosomal protein L7/L12